MTQPITHSTSESAARRPLANDFRLGRTAQSEETSPGVASTPVRSDEFVKGTKPGYTNLDPGWISVKSRGAGLTGFIYRSLRMATSVLTDAEQRMHQTAAISSISGRQSRKSPHRLQPAYDLHVRRSAERFALNPELLRSMIEVESAGNAYAISSRNAKGLMQLTDSTAEMLGVENVWDPAENIHGGAKYLRQLLDQFGGNLTEALAAYNAGPAAVRQFGGVPPYEETQTYVERVLNHYRNRLGGKANE